PRDGLPATRTHRLRRDLRVRHTVPALGHRADRRIFHREPHAAARSRRLPRPARPQRRPRRRDRLPHAGLPRGAGRAHLERAWPGGAHPDDLQRPHDRTPRGARPEGRPRRLRPLEGAILMQYIDLHAHMVSRTTDDYEQMAMTGCVAVTEPAFWAGWDRSSADGFEDYFRQLTTFEPVRAAKYGIQHYTWLCLNPKEGEDRELAREVLRRIPKYLDRPNVLGIG